MCVCVCVCVSKDVHILSKLLPKISCGVLATIVRYIYIYISKWI